jgi:hypothetical protein
MLTEMQHFLLLLQSNVKKATKLQWKSITLSKVKVVRYLEYKGSFVC